MTLIWQVRPARSCYECLDGFDPAPTVPRALSTGHVPQVLGELLFVDARGFSGGVECGEHRIARLFGDRAYAAGDLLAGGRKPGFEGSKPGVHFLEACFGLANLLTGLVGDAAAEFFARLRGAQQAGGDANREARRRGGDDGKSGR